jgi:agmatinase
MLHGDTEFCFENIREFVRKIISKNAIPAAMGGDHAITTAILQALDSIGSFTVVQIDAHLDWVDNIAGQKNGQGSPMRRASELPYVNGMAQLGIRGSGSSSMSYFKDAKEYGSVIMNLISQGKFLF